MARQPRHYQITALEHVRADIERGTYDVIVKMPTGTGKSLTQNIFTQALAPIQQYRTIFIGGFKRDLCLQAIEGYEENYPDVSNRIEVKGRMVNGIGLVMHNDNDVSARVVVCSAQTIANRELNEDGVLENEKVKKSDLLLNEGGGVELSPLSKRRFLISPRFDEILKWGFPKLWIHDECFAAGTLIDGQPIENLKVGDVVTAFNETTQQFEKKKVVRLFIHKPKGDVVRVKIAGTALICTANHPFYTQRGWVAAGELNVQDKVLRSDLLSMWSGSYSESANGSQKNRSVAGIWQNILLNRVYTKNCQRRVLQTHGRDQSQIRFRTDEEKQSDAYAWYTRQNETHIAAYPMEAPDSRRERNRIHRTAAHTGNSVGGRLAYGAAGGHAEAEAGRLPDCLQNRHCAPGIHDCNRGGWEEPSRIDDQGGRSEENRFSKWIGVDSVTVLEQSSDGTYGGMLPDGLVYNFEVEELHTYIANGIVVHNCHHAPADSTLFIIQQLKEMARLLKLSPMINVGFTATPMRNDGIALASVYDKVSYAYSDRAATEEGYILPVADAIRVQIMAEGGGGYKLKMVENWTDRVIEAWEAYGRPRDCSAFFVGPINGSGAIEASKILRQAFQDHGVDAVHIDGQNWIDVDGKVKSNKGRKGLYTRIKQRKIPVVCNFDVIGEGIDLPIIDTIFLLRSVNEVNFTQIMGRARRRFGDQTDALLVDFTGQELVLLMHGTMTGVKKDMLKEKVIPEFVDNTEDDENETILTGMNMRDASPMGVVQGLHNSYKPQAIMRRSKMQWYQHMDGDMSLACSRFKKKDEAEGGRGDALLLRSPYWTVADHYSSILDTDQPEKVLEIAGFLQRIYSSFSLWHTRGLFTGQMINNYWVRDQELVSGDPLYMHEAMDEVEGYAAMYAENSIPFYDASIASKKGSSWRRGSVSAYQMPLFKALFPDDDPSKYSSGSAAQLITYKLSSDVVKATLKDAEDWIVEMTGKKVPDAAVLYHRAG